MQTPRLFRGLRRLIVLLGLLGAAGGVLAAESSQPARFLLIFETSPAVKKNLPAIRQSLAHLFATSFQQEIRDDDDLAVWTVDEGLHTGTFPLASWTPENAEAYATQLNDFLSQQKFTRHASLAAIQPLLNRVVKNSERLTVIIYCDSQCRLTGTPYDAGVNETITNAAVKTKRGAGPLILLLRSYQGEYLGCSVNRQGTLNFPAFPPPPAPEPPPVTNKPVVVAPPVSGPVVAPVPALIIVGTNATTNVAAATKPANPALTPWPPTNPAAATTPGGAATSPLPPENAANVPSLPLSNPPSVKNLTAAGGEARSASSSPAVVSTSSEPGAASPPPSLTTKSAGAAPEKSSSGRGYLWPLASAGGALVAAGFVIWLVARARRPHSSLITSSLQNPPNLPPRK
jgi:hypothetical protein